jgi:hypothetical protein
MKKFKIYLVLISVLSLGSCTKDLELTTPNQFEDANFWTSENNVRAYNWGFYNMFLGYGIGTGTSADFYFSAFTDDQAQASFTQFVQNAAATNGNWNWEQIRKANIMIERVRNVNSMTDEAKNHWEGVARFFRALDYFNKVRIFGDVPYIDQSLDIDDINVIYKPRDSRKVVIQKVLEDLDFAIANLRATDQHNTITKPVAYALKARVALFEGTLRKYQTHLNLTADAVGLLTQAKDAAFKVMETGSYIINPDYQIVYNSLDLSTNKQVILYKKYVTGVQGHSVINYLTSTTIMQGLTKAAVESYVTTDGLPISQVGGAPLYAGDNTIASVRTNRDNRLLKTIADYVAYEKNLVVGANSSTGYVPIKFVNRNTNLTGGQNDTDAPLFNYAEILLIYAEAMAELGLLDQPALDRSINLLRARAGVAKLNYDGVNVMSGSTGTTIINDVKRPSTVSALLWEVRRERRVELMMDGFRVDDLNRWALGSNISISQTALTDEMLGIKLPDQTSIPEVNRVPAARISPTGYYKPYTTGTRTFITPKHYLTAVPTGQISLYLPYGGMAQNEGW